MISHGLLSTSDRTAAPMPLREQISRGFLVAAFLLLVASGFLLCFCWWLYGAVAACSILSFCFGSRQQRLVAVIPFVVAVIVGTVDYRHQDGLHSHLAARPLLPFDFDALMTAFWIGFACISASLISRRRSVVAVLLFWCAIFPILENMGREVLRAFLRRHPTDLWSLTLVTVSAYLLAAGIAAYRFVRYSRKARHA